MSKERIEEVAWKLAHLNLDEGESWLDAYRDVVGTFPEFLAAPQSAWVPFVGLKDGFDNHKSYLLKTQNSIVVGSYQTHGGCNIVAYMEIPPYVPPESELVRRFRNEYAAGNFSVNGTNLNDVACSVLARIEKELNDAKK